MAWLVELEGEVKNIENRTDDFSIEDNKDKLVKYVSKKLAGVGRVVDFFMPINAEAKSEG
jgi:hypothetical protein